MRNLKRNVNSLSVGNTSLRITVVAIRNIVAQRAEYFRSASAISSISFRRLSKFFISAAIGDKCSPAQRAAVCFNESGTEAGKADST